MKKLLLIASLLLLSVVSDAQFVTGSASGGAASQQIAVGTGLNLSGTTLTATGSSGILTTGLTLTNAANAYTQTSTGLSITSGTTGFGRNITGTVNDASAVDGIIDFANITCTLCTATSYFVDWQAGGVSQFKVSTTGTVTMVALNATTSASAHGFIPTASTAITNGMNLPATNTIGLVANSTSVETISSTLDTHLTAVISGGTPFTVASGTGACATSSTLVGGVQAGHLTCTGTTGASTVTLTLAAATHGYFCGGRDVTTPTTVTQTGAISATSVTLTLASVTANDVIQFGCGIGY